MWLNEKFSVYFFPEPLKCYNFMDKSFFAVRPGLKIEWANNGKSHRIGADCLADWSEE